MKNKIALVSLSLVCGISLQAVDISSLANNLVSSGLSYATSKIFNEMDKATGEVVSKCYAPSNSNSSSISDICSYVNQIGSINDDVCSYLPGLPGLSKKKHSLGVNGALSDAKSGLQSYCQSKTREFEDVFATTQAQMLEMLGDDNKQKLPNGMDTTEFDGKWSQVKSIVAKNKPSLFSKAFRDGDQNVLRAIMDYDRLKGSDDINEIKIEDLKAPSSIEDYKQNRQELADNYSNNRLETLPSNISAGVGIKLQQANVKGTQAHLKAQEITTNAKKQIKLARATEISLALDNNKRAGDYVMPTQEMVEMARLDLRPKIIAEIRDQQVREALTIAMINEKWDTREALIDLLATKEVILNEPFDEASAKSEIEAIVNSNSSSSSGSSSSGGIGSNVGNYTNSILKVGE